MEYLHAELELGPTQSVVVTLDHAANVRVMDSINFERYRRGDRHDFYGGYATTSPVVIRPPRAGRWHVAVDLGGYAGQVRASIGVN